MFLSKEFTPQMISLDKMNGVSFDKGCYPGQEIVARTHYLGESSKELYSFKLKNKEFLKFKAHRRQNCSPPV